MSQINMIELITKPEIKGLIVTDEGKDNEVLLFCGESPSMTANGFYIGDGDLVKNALCFERALIGIQNNQFEVDEVILSDRDLKQTIPMITKYKNYQLRILPKGRTRDALCWSTAYYARLLEIMHMGHNWTSCLSNTPYEFDEYWYLTRPISKQLSNRVLESLNKKRQLFNLEPINTKFCYLDAVAHFSALFSPEQMMHWINQMSFKDSEQHHNYPYLEMGWIVKHPGANAPYLLSYLLEKAAIHYQKSIVLAKPYSGIVQKMLKKGYIEETTKPTTMKGKGFGKYGN